MMAWLREALVWLLVYLTNHVVTHVPSHRVRRAWYRAMGLPLGADSAIHLGCYVWFYGPRHLAAMDVRIGSNTIINRNCCLDFYGVRSSSATT